MSFIKHGNQYINLTSPLSAEITSGAKGAFALRFRDAMGREIAHAGGVDFDLERLTAPLLSANATVLCVSSAGNVTAAVIVGYRVCRTGLEPLYLVEPPEDTTKFLMAGAHGLVRLDDGSIYPNIEHAKAAVLGVQPDQAESAVEPMPKLAVGGRRVR